MAFSMMKTNAKLGIFVQTDGMCKSKTNFRLVIVVKDFII